MFIINNNFNENLMNTNKVLTLLSTTNLKLKLKIH